VRYECSQTLVSSVSTADAPARLRTVGVAQLTAGGNVGVCVPCRVAQAISHPTAAPLHYVMVRALARPLARLS